jgi:hypothetical protein
MPRIALGRDAEGGFRGVQSKSLMDIIQMECISQSSTVMRITRGSLVGKLWIQGGELIDAEAEGGRGEAAFRRILEWKSGTFENLPADPDRERTIHKSVNALLLETAQAMDEVANPTDTGPAEEAEHRRTVWRLSALTREGAEWVVSAPDSGAPQGWGTQAAPEVAQWMRQAVESCRRLSERIEGGPLSYIIGNSMARRVALLPWTDKSFLVAWPPNVEVARVLEQTKKLVASWDS